MLKKGVIWLRMAGTNLSSEHSGARWPKSKFCSKIFIWAWILMFAPSKHSSWQTTLIIEVKHTSSEWNFLKNDLELWLCYYWCKTSIYKANFQQDWMTVKELSKHCVTLISTQVKYPKKWINACATIQIWRHDSTNLHTVLSLPSAHEQKVVLKFI